MAVPEKADAKSSTDKILKQILDVAEQQLEVSKQNLEISKQILATAQASNDFLARITEVVESFAHNYSVSVEQVVLTKPKAQPTPSPKR